MLGSFVVPAFAAEILQIGSGRAVERLRERQLNALFDDSQTAHGVNRLSGVPDAIQSGDAPSIALPFAQTRDVELPVVGIKACSHAGGSEAKRKFHHAALHLAIGELLL